jgi:nucleotide-binding universal stress UspA family protein
MIRVLVAIDDSRVSVRAASEAARLFPDAEFLVLNVTKPFVPVAGGDFGVVYPVNIADLTMSPDELAERIHQAGVEPIETIQEFGDPARVICEAAEKHDADVVVLGSHDKGLIHRIFAPSVADAVVHGTHRAVLVVSGAETSSDAG